MKKLLLSFLVLGSLFACKKDKVGSKPVISFLRYGAPSLDSSSSELDVVFKVKDGDGDIENSINWRIHFQQAKTPPIDTNYTAWNMPNIGANKGNSVNAEVTMRMISSDFYLWNEDKGARPDSMWLSVYIIDNAGHVSDTVNTPTLPIFKRRT